MQRVVGLLQYLLFPFELLGAFLFALPIVLWKCLTFACGKFLLSPWGLLIPATFLVLLFFVVQVSQTPFHIAEQYAKELQTCDEKDIPVYTALLIQLDEAGLSGLVSGINSERQAVFNACFEGLQNEIRNRHRYRNSKNPFRWELQLSKALQEQAPQFRSSGQAAAAVLTRSLIRSLAEGFELSNNRIQNDDGRKANRNCIAILDLLETNSRATAGNSDNSERRETAALFHPRYAHPVLMAENGKPLFSPHNMESSINEELLADTMSVPNAERLIAYYQSPQFHASQNRSSPESQPDTLRNNTGGTYLARTRTSEPALAGVSGKTVREYKEIPVIDETEEIDIISDYISERNPPKKLKRDDNSQPSEKTDGDFINDKFESIPVSKVPSLPTIQLMKLLHSGDSQIVSEVQKTLTARDGFRELHLKLAYELYHPDSAVRKELIAKIPQTAGIPQHIWLLELTNDPDADVRYQAMVYLTTTSDPALRRQLAEKSKRDTDQRIVNLAEKIGY
ncbi:MAG: hypothetical protein FWE67_02875 [Planctomycetaceae bacterium]|nr:hypothetical protein [Planctomycetaceae bacterium]